MKDIHTTLMDLSLKALPDDRKAIVTNNDGFVAYFSTLPHKMRFSHKTLAERGHTNVMFGGLPVIAKADCKPGYHLGDLPDRWDGEIKYPKVDVAFEKAATA